MLRACGKRRMLAAAGVAALVLIGAGCTSEQVSQTPASARIAVSEKSVVYVQIQGGEVRAAMSLEGLRSAAPVRTGPNSRCPFRRTSSPSASRRSRRAWG